MARKCNFGAKIVEPGVKWCHQFVARCTSQIGSPGRITENTTTVQKWEILKSSKTRRAQNLHKEASEAGMSIKM